MITIVEGHNMNEHADLVSAMYRQRARYFGMLSGVVVNERGEERDSLDDEALPVYVISHLETSLLGSLRLLPTTGPTLCQRAFADTVPDIAGLSAPSIWECSRLCAIDRHEMLKLFGAVGELSPRAGIESIICNVEGPSLDLYRRWLDIKVLGQTDRFGSTVYLGIFPMDTAIVAVNAALMKRAS